MMPVSMTLTAVRLLVILLLRTPVIHLAAVRCLSDIAAYRCRTILVAGLRGVSNRRHAENGAGRLVRAVAILWRRLVPAVLGVLMVVLVVVGAVARDARRRHLRAAVGHVPPRRILLFKFIATDGMLVPKR